MCLIKYHILKPYGGGGVCVHTFILALDRQEWLPSCHRHCIPCATETWSCGTSDKAPMLWTPQNLFPLPEFEPKVLGHAASSTAATMTDLSQLPSSLLLPNIKHSCYNDWPCPALFQSAVTQHTTQLLQWLTYPSYLPLCCYPTYSTALHEQQIVAHWVKCFLTVLGTFIKHSQK